MTEATKPKQTRKRKYRDGMLEDARTFGALGYGTKDMGAIWGVTQRTVERWAKEKPEFKASMDQGKHIANSSVVKALFENATIKGNVVAQIYWTKNRDPENWKERVEHTGEIASTITILRADGKEEIKNEPSTRLGLTPGGIKIERSEN